MDVPDVSALVAIGLHAEAGINMMRKDYKLLNCKLNASKSESEAITKKTDLVLHPDNDGFNQWLLNSHLMLDQLRCEEFKANRTDSPILEKQQGQALRSGPGQLP